MRPFFLLLLIAAIPAWAQPAGVPSVTPDGVLVRDGKPFRAIGVNYFDCFSRTLANPDDTSYDQGFAELSKRGIPFARFMATGFYPVNLRLYTEDKEAYFKLFDGVVASAGKHGVGLIPSVCWFHVCVPDLVGEPVSAWGKADSKTIAWMKQYTRELVGRYKDNPAIWAWELGNELDLVADLPNADTQRPGTYTDLGMPATRSAADDITREMLTVAFKEFAATVRDLDKVRPVTTGNAGPRPAAQHMHAEKSWTLDSPEEYIAAVAEFNPRPMDMISIHIYPGSLTDRFYRDDFTYEELLAVTIKAAGKTKQALFVGEFGEIWPDTPAGNLQAKKEIPLQIAAIEKSGIQLASFWVYDFEGQAADFSVTATNHRAIALDWLEAANKRLSAK